MSAERDPVARDPAVRDPAVRDPFLDLPLDGLRLIEASAGTGKTYTLATLVARLVIERGLSVSRILAVTFTDAATQELRERLRRRLLLAARIAADDPSLDEAGDDAERALTRALVRAQAGIEGEAPLRARLQRAAREIDLAAVVTIHGFCARVLAEHALETGQAFAAPELIGSERELHDEIAVDLWRAFGNDAGEAELLALQWPAGPPALGPALPGFPPDRRAHRRSGTPVRRRLRRRSRARRPSRPRRFRSTGSGRCRT